MRTFLTGLAVAGLLTSHAAFAAGCGQNAEQAAFDVVGLKSQLMVTAITCKAEDKYNAFINRYKNDLVGQEKVLKSYFARTYGRNAQSRQDDYTTQLAQAQAQAALKRGTLFCSEYMDAFDEAMALRGGNELEPFAAGKGIVQPADYTTCSTVAPTASPHATVRKAVAHTTAKKKH